MYVLVVIISINQCRALRIDDLILFIERFFLISENLIIIEMQVEYISLDIVIEVELWNLAH